MSNAGSLLLSLQLFLPHKGLGWYSREIRYKRVHVLSQVQAVKHQLWFPPPLRLLGRELSLAGKLGNCLSDNGCDRSDTAGILSVTNTKYDCLMITPTIVTLTKTASAKQFRYLQIGVGLLFTSLLLERI